MPDCEAGKKKRRLTNLYNAHPTWLDLANKRLYEAVFVAYGWKSDLRDEEILEKLLAFGSLRFASPPSHPSGMLREGRYAGSATQIWRGASPGDNQFSILNHIAYRLLNNVR
jgi:hypothetical protein